MKWITTISKYAAHYFALWVIMAAVIGFFHPAAFVFILPHIKLCLGIIMFGMGMTLSVADFKRIMKHPGDVLIGVAAQYIVMPLVAFGICRLLRLSPELAVGVILLGACPGGTASNVICYLARADVALSVSMTTVSTLLSPVLTPILTLWLAGHWMHIAAGSLFISIIQIVLVPVILGVVAQRFFAKVVAQCIQVLPLISVLTIVLVVGAIVGKSADRLAQMALVVFIAVILHNGLGLLLGYGLACLARMGVLQRRTVAIEVGMQNSGLAVTLATVHFSPVTALPGALFSVWHNITGPILATWWSRRVKCDTNENN